MGGLAVYAEIHQADCLKWLRAQPSDSVDLVFCSPPYEAARKYGELDFKLQGQDWVDWAAEIYRECVRVSRGLTAWVVEGRTQRFRWSATPALLMADLHRSGVKLRKPPAFVRVGIPGSGGPDWWRNDYEFVVCAAKGRLPWSDNKAIGKPPKYGPGGRISHRTQSGERVSEQGRREYSPPEVANPGNVLRLHGGGGHLGSRLAHENEAPFPEKLAEAFIKCFCPPGGVVLDPFVGSGTTVAVALREGRIGIGVDCRASQVDLASRRVFEVLAEIQEREVCK